MISAEAVEAAMNAISYVKDDLSSLSERGGAEVHREMEGIIRSALEAAAPYMLAVDDLHAKAR